MGRGATTALTSVLPAVVVLLGGTWFLNSTRPGLELKCRLLNSAYPAAGGSATSDAEIQTALDKAAAARKSAAGRYASGLKTAKGYVKQGRGLEAKANQLCTGAENAGR